MTWTLIVWGAIVLGTLLLVWRRARGGMATAALCLLAPCALLIAAPGAERLVQALEIRNAVYLGTLLFVAIAAKCALRLSSSGPTLTALVSHLTWTDLALVLAFASFVGHYACLGLHGLLNLDFMEFTTFDFSTYRMLRNGSLMDFDTYDVDLIKPSGTRYYIALCLWIASLWAKALSIANPLIAHPIWFYLRAARISIYLAQALFLLGAYGVGRKMFSPVAGIVAMILLGSSSSAFDIAFSVRDDYPVLVLACLGLWAYLRYQAQPSAQRLLLTGVMAGGGLAFRMTILPILLGIAGHFTWTVLREKPLRPRPLVRQLVLFAGLFGGPCFLWFLLSKPHRFYWPGLFQRAQQNLQVYLGWSDLMAASYRPVMALPFHERFWMLIRIFGDLFDRNIPLLVCGAIALVYYLCVRRNSLVAFLTLGNLAFWVLLCWFPEATHAWHPHYLIVTGLLLTLVVGGFLAVELPACLRALLPADRRWRFASRWAPVVASAAGFAIMLVPVIRGRYLLAALEGRWTVDLAKVQGEVLSRIPLGSSILINASLGDSGSGTVPNPNIYETYGSDLDQMAVPYMAPLTEYFVNLGGGSAYDKLPKTSVVFPEWIRDVETFRNANTAFGRRRSIYETYPTRDASPGGLVGTVDAASKWRFLFNEDLYLSPDRSEPGLTVSISQGRDSARQGAPALQPSGVGFFRKRFQYNIRVPAESEYDAYWNAEGSPPPLARAAIAATPDAGQFTLSADPGDPPGVPESEGSRAFVRFEIRRQTDDDTHVTSSGIAVAPDTYYRLVLDLRTKGIYRVNPIVHEVSSDEPQRSMATPFEPLPVSGGFRQYEILYRTTSRAGSISIDLEVQRIAGTLDIRDIRVWPKGAGRVFDVAKAARVLPVDWVRGDRRLAIDFTVPPSEARGQVNLEVLWESHDGLPIGRSIYHLYNNGMKLWDSTEYLSDQRGENRSVWIPLWQDFARKSPYGSLVHFVKLYIMVASPRGSSLDVSVRRMELAR